MLSQILLLVIILIVVFSLRALIGFTLGLFDEYLPNTAFITRVTTFVIYWGLLLLMFVGPANKNTANDNTSGVTTLLDIMLSLPESEKDKIAFVFFDLEELGMIGSSSFASKYKKELGNKMVLNFDCVSDGETILFALKKSSRKYKDVLADSFISNQNVTVDIAEKGVFYPSDNSSFKGGIGVAALKKSKRFGFLYLDRIHTVRDTIYREENIEFLKNGAIKLAKTL